MSVLLRVSSSSGSVAFSAVLSGSSIETAARERSQERDAKDWGACGRFSGEWGEWEISMGELSGEGSRNHRTIYTGCAQQTNSTHAHACAPRTRPLARPRAHGICMDPHAVSHARAHTARVYKKQTHTHAPIPSVCFFPSSGVLPHFFPFLGTFLGTAEHIDATAAEDKDGVGELVAQEPRLQRSRLRVEHVFIRASSVDDYCVCTLPQLSGSAGALPKATRQSQQLAQVGVRRWGGKTCEEEVGELCAG